MIKNIKSLEENMEMDLPFASLEVNSCHVPFPSHTPLPMHEHHLNPLTVTTTHTTLDPNPPDCVIKVWRVENGYIIDLDGVKHVTFEILNINRLIKDHFDSKMANA